MFPLALKTVRPLLVVWSFLAASSFALAQDPIAPPTAETAPALDGAPAVDETPIVPAAPFPALMALGGGNQVWMLKVSDGRLKVNGDVIVNSINKGALWIANGSIAVEKGSVGVAGGVSRLGRTSIDPVPVLGARAALDPLPSFHVGAGAALISREKLFLQTEAGGDDTVLPPGIYNGGIFASGDGHITLQPGIFVINNGDFSAIGPTIEGEGVTIVMAGNQTGALSFSLGAKFNASAPREGRLKGLLIVSRASGALARGVSFSVAQGQMRGLIYAPGSSVSFESKARAKVSQIIAKSVDVTGSTLEVTGPITDETEAAPAEATPATAAP